MKITKSRLIEIIREEILAETNITRTIKTVGGHKNAPYDKNKLTRPRSEEDPPVEKWTNFSSSQQEHDPTKDKDYKKDKKIKTEKKADFIDRHAKSMKAHDQRRMDQAKVDRYKKQTDRMDALHRMQHPDYYMTSKSADKYKKRSTGQIRKKAGQVKNKK
jgi:hypothetical protein